MAQQAPSAASGEAGSLTPSIYAGSVPAGKITPEVLPLSFREAIDRSLRTNLALLLQADNQLNARGQKWKELSALLPNIDTTTTEFVEQINLAALGFRFKTPGIPEIVGPIGVFQTQVNLHQSVFDLNAIDKAKSAKASESAANYNYKNARDLVVLATGNAYLETIAGASTVDTAESQVQTAQALYDKASAQQSAGVSPAIDTLRAKVELQTRQQQLIQAHNNYAKEKLTLARVIGLPAGQEFSITDKSPYQPYAAMSVQEALQRAYASRPDYLAAQQQVRAAQFSRDAASAERYPALNISGYYGDAGIRLGDSHGIFEVGAVLSIPVFAGNKVHGDVLQAEAALRQSQQQLENLRGAIDYDVRAALLDLQSAADQVEVARSNVDLANQTLEQARDRFSAGVTDNLEVIQAQESVAQANENYISSLYSHNLAKISLVRAIGFAEEGVKQYLQGK
jgi:outer membrane protein TolC